MRTVGRRNDDNNAIWTLEKRRFLQNAGSAFEFCILFSGFSYLREKSIAPYVGYGRY